MLTELFFPRILSIRIYQAGHQVIDILFPYQLNSTLENLRVKLPMLAADVHSLLSSPRSSKPLFQFDSLT
jgi:hypothetical protein